MRRLLMVLAGIGVAVVTAAGQNGGGTNAATTTRATNIQVIAYYFHGTVRCVECLKIEKQAKELLEQKYRPELAAKRLVFKSVNYDEPANAHFLLDYKLPCPSLVLVRQQGGKDVAWKLLGETWQRVESPEKFAAYLEAEVGRMLTGPK